MEKQKKDEGIVEEKALSPEEAASKSWEDFEKFYKQLLAGSGTVVLLGIAVAVLVSVLGGAAIFVAGCGLYLYFTKDELKTRLSLGYRRASDGWAVTPVETKKREVLWVPEKLMGLAVTELFATEGSVCESFRELCLPTSIRRIEADLLRQLPNLEKINFFGTKEQWERVEMPALPQDCELIFLNQDKISD